MRNIHLWLGLVTATKGAVFVAIGLAVFDLCGASDTCFVTVNVDSDNQAPVATCPGDTSLFVCNLSEICVSGFSASDPDGNLLSVAATGGTLAGDSICFVPAEGVNLITLVATDSCGLTDTCVTTVTVTRIIMRRLITP